MNKLKGKILEIIVVDLLKSCGFKDVPDDNIYIYKSNLRWINGKGARHDADVLLAPPYQIPFCYPTRLIVECKNYDQSYKIGLPIVRNVLGLRSDINDFEIITKEQLLDRKNQKRCQYAVELRERYLYQAGVASVSGFTKPAIEFSFNNKIPLIDITAIIKDIKGILNKIDARSEEINKKALDRISQQGLIAGITQENAKQFGITVDSDELIDEIAKQLDEAKQSIIVGVLNTGDIIFLKADEKSKEALYKSQLANTLSGNQCTIHYDDVASNWYIRSSFNGNTAILNFQLPKEYFQLWKTENFSRASAINIKESAFKSVSLFGSYGEFLISVNMELNDDWISAIKDDLDETDEESESDK